MATIAATVVKLAIDSIFESAQEAQKSFVTTTVAGENIAGRATAELAREGQLRDKTLDAVAEEKTRLIGELQGLGETPISGLQALKGDLTGGPGIAAFLRGREAFREGPVVGRLDKEGKLIEGKAKTRIDVISEQLTVLNKILEISGNKFKKDAEIAGEILKKKVEEAKAPTKLNATDVPQKGPVGG